MKFCGEKIWCSLKINFSEINLFSEINCQECFNGLEDNGYCSACPGNECETEVMMSLIPKGCEDSIASEVCMPEAERLGSHCEGFNS